MILIIYFAIPAVRNFLRRAMVGQFDQSVDVVAQMASSENTPEVGALARVEELVVNPQTKERAIELSLGTEVSFPTEEQVAESG